MLLACTVGTERRTLRAVAQLQSPPLSVSCQREANLDPDAMVFSPRYSAGTRGGARLWRGAHLCVLQRHICARHRSVGKVRTLVIPSRRSSVTRFQWEGIRGCGRSALFAGAAYLPCVGVAGIPTGDRRSVSGCLVVCGLSVACCCRNCVSHPVNCCILRETIIRVTGGMKVKADRDEVGLKSL